MNKHNKPNKWFIVFLCMVIFCFNPLITIHAARITDQNRAASRPVRHSGQAPDVPKQKQRESERYVTIDFNDVDITVFIKFISELTGKNFIVDRRVNGKVSIISPTKISVNEAFKVFESVLEVHGFALVEAGAVTKVIPATEARTKNIETRLREEAIDPDDSVITQIIHLNYAEPEEVKKLFSPLISKSSVILSYPQTDMLIVTDVLSNIQRLLHILTVIDVEGVGQQISLIHIEQDSASNMVKTLTSIFGKATKKRRGQTDDQVHIVADDRTNSIIILASEDDTIKVKELIAMLDTEVPRAEGKIRVYYLEHATAEELVKVLKDLPGKQDKDSKGKAPIISKDVAIAADKSTNSLIITAERDDYLVLEDVIKKLDIPRSMVYIECVIMEVSTNKSIDIGVKWRVGEDYNSSGGGAFSKGAFFGSFGSPPIVMDATNLQSFGDATIGVVGDTITVGGIQIPSISALVNAVKNDNDVDIISTPQILTTDNEEAEIRVGETIPYITRSGSSDSSIDYNNYEYKDVGVLLKVKPQINNNGYIRLVVEQEVKDVVQDSIANILAPRTTVRSSKTTVLVRDNQTIVISGMIDDKKTVSRSSLPCLGQVPLLSWLFKTFYNKQEKTNLFVFLTPHILENNEEAVKFHEDKMKDINKSMQIEDRSIKLYKKSILHKE